MGEAQISFGMSSGDYTDAGATADDLDDGDLTEQIVIVNGVDVLYLTHILLHIMLLIQMEMKLKK